MKGGGCWSLLDCIYVTTAGLEVVLAIKRVDKWGNGIFAGYVGDVA